jgi:hypothetical protein
MPCSLCAVFGPVFSHPTNKLIKIGGWFYQLTYKQNIFIMDNYVPDDSRRWFHQFKSYRIASLLQGKRQKRGRNMRENRAVPTQQDWRKNEVQKEEKKAAGL